MNIKEFNSPVAENVKRIITETGYKQCVIAARIGHTPQELTDMISGRRIIKISDILKFCTALGVGINDLFKPIQTDKESGSAEAV